MARNDRERTALVVGRFVTELEQGGLSAFLYNISPDASSSQCLWSELRETVEALRRIEAGKTADALALLIPLLEAPAPPGPTWQSFLQERGIDLNAYQTRLEEPEELWAHLDELVGGGSS